MSESSPALPRNSRWTDYTPDGSGYPNLERIASRNALVAGVQPRVTTAQISPGDTYNVVFATSAGPVTVPTTLSSYFVTTPAITSYGSGGAQTSLSYPIAPGSPGCCGLGAGSPDGNPIQMESERLRLTFWRPSARRWPAPRAAASWTWATCATASCPQDRESRARPVARATTASCPPRFAPRRPPGTTGPGSSRSSTAPTTEPPIPGRRSRSRSTSAPLRAAGMSTAGRAVGLTLTAAGDPRPGGQDRAAQQIAVRLPG